MRYQTKIICMNRLEMHQERIMYQEWVISSTDHCLYSLIISCFWQNKIFGTVVGSNVCRIIILSNGSFLVKFHLFHALEMYWTILHTKVSSHIAMHSKAFHLELYRSRSKEAWQTGFDGKAIKMPNLLHFRKWFFISERIVETSEEVTQRMEVR